MNPTEKVRRFDNPIDFRAAARGACLSELRARGIAWATDYGPTVGDVVHPRDPSTWGAWRQMVTALDRDRVLWWHARRPVADELAMAGILAGMSVPDAVLPFDELGGLVADDLLDLAIALVTVSRRHVLLDRDGG